MRRGGYEERKAVNEASRNRAKHHAEPWLGYEDELLLAWDGSEDELIDLSEMLGRTIEACRQRFYVVRRNPGRRVVEHRETTTTTTTSSRVVWEDDDEWPDWYVRG